MCISTKSQSVSFSRYFCLCNVLHVCNIQAIPTYRVSRLYDSVKLAGMLILLCSPPNVLFRGEEDHGISHPWMTYFPPPPWKLPMLIIATDTTICDVVSEATGSSLCGCEIKTFSGGACPQNPLVWLCLWYYNIFPPWTKKILYNPATYDVVTAFCIIFHTALLGVL